MHPASLCQSCTCLPTGEEQSLPLPFLASQLPSLFNAERSRHGFLFTEPSECSVFPLIFPIAHMGMSFFGGTPQNGGFPCGFPFDTNQKGYPRHSHGATLLQSAEPLGKFRTLRLLGGLSHGDGGYPPSPLPWQLTGNWSLQKETYLPGTFPCHLSWKGQLFQVSLGKLAQHEALEVCNAQTSTEDGFSFFSEPEAKRIHFFPSESECKGRLNDFTRSS